MNKPVKPPAVPVEQIDTDYDNPPPNDKPLSPADIAQIEATCGPVPKSKGGTGPG